MTATSTQGVGPGAAEGTDQQSKHWSVGGNRVLGPRIVASGIKALSGGAATVVLPLLEGVVADYIVLVNDATGAAAVSGSLAFNTNDSTVTLAGTGTHSIHWCIVKVGLAL